MAQDTNIGQMLDNRYKITELIGVGGMADVYRGSDIVDNKTVAIKILKTEFADNEEFLSRFRNESKAIALLSHPNIVKIYDVGFSENLQYIIMEYIDGITLKDYIEEKHALNWKDAVHFMIQILRALQHAHEKGIVHRDIKPQNIMMLNDGTIKVMDFGIAKFSRETGKTATDQAIGSVHYISPEQAKGEATDEKSDIYSVGVMLYEMLTGQKPFDSDNSVSIAVMNINDTPKRPRAVNPNVPAGLEEIILKAMEKNPLDRYQSASAMIQDIERFKANPDISFGYYIEDNGDSEETRYFNAVEQSEYNEENGQTGKRTVTAVEEPSRRRKRHEEEVADDDEDEEEEEEKGSLFVPVLTAITIAVIIGGVIFVASLVMNMFQGDSGEKFDYKMPNLIGVDYNEAINKYGGTINIVVDSQEYNEVEKNCIFEQDIEPETPFNKGDTVKVKVSKGMKTIKVPDGTDINVNIYKNSLQELGLKIDIKSDTSDSIQKDNIIRTEPEAGTDVEPGTVILVYVSAGVNKEQIKLDNFVGKTIEEAMLICSYKSISNVKREDAPSYEKEGIVFEQSIPKDTVIESDQELILYVSNGVYPDGEVTFNVSLPDNSEGRFVLDFFSDNDSKTIMSSGVILAPEMANTSVQVKGTGKDIPITVYITNQSNNLRSRIGQYNFDFSTASYTANWEDVYTAISEIDGFHKETQAPTEAPEAPPTEYVEPTEPPTEYIEPTEPPTEYIEPTTEPTVQPSTTVGGYTDNDGDGIPDNINDIPWVDEDGDGINDNWPWVDNDGDGFHDWLG